MLLAEYDAQTGSVLNRHACALALIRHHLGNLIRFIIKSLWSVGTHWMRRIAHDTDHPLLPVIIRLMHPQPPRTDFSPNLEMFEQLGVEIGERGEQLLDSSLTGPVLRTVVSLFAGEEAIVGQQTASITRRKDDLMDVVVATPVFEGTILGVVHKTELHSGGGIDIGMQTARVGWLLLGVNTDDTPNSRANAVRSNHQFMPGSDTIFKCDEPGVDVDIFTLLTVLGLSA